MYDESKQGYRRTMMSIGSNEFDVEKWSKRSGPWVWVYMHSVQKCRYLCMKNCVSEEKTSLNCKISVV